MVVTGFRAHAAQRNVPSQNSGRSMRAVVFVR
jgi:hypothetical protein